VSEPVTDYIRYEHAGAVVNVSAGEQVRWLPRRRAVELLLPGADLWIFGGTQVLFNHFTGTGDGRAGTILPPPLHPRSRKPLAESSEHPIPSIETTRSTE
jgi:hypothetical protein